MASERFAEILNRHVEALEILYMESAVESKWDAEETLRLFIACRVMLEMEFGAGSSILASFEEEAYHQNITESKIGHDHVLRACLEILRDIQRSVALSAGEE